MNCSHVNFESYVSVGRIHEEGKPEVITGYTADIVIRCADCKIPFEFVGVPGGYSPTQPMVNFDATELRAPIKPSSDPVEHVKVLLNREK